MTKFWGLPDPASSYALDIDKGLWIIHIAMFAIFILWGIFFAYLLIRYRARKEGHAHREQGSHTFGSLLPDIIVVVFELGLIFLYAIPVWSRIKMDVPPEANANVVQVVAQQFAWNVRYPGPDGKFGKMDPSLIHFSNPLGLDLKDPAAQDDVILANEIHLPVGRPTLINLSSFDVIHSFFVPAFRIKQDAVPGMVIPVWVTPTKVGTYELSCAQLCGFAHSLMAGTVVVQSEEDYEAWLKSRVPQAPAAPAPAAQSF